MLARLVNSLPFCLSQPITKLFFRALQLGQRGNHSVPEYHKYKNMDVKILPALKDNYMYLIIDKDTRQAAVVDPVAHMDILKAVEECGVQLTAVLTTHHHWDHAGGNEELVKVLTNLQVYGGDDRIAGLNNKVQHGTQFNVGNLTVQCLATPCHTTGHICYFVTAPGLGESAEPAVFTGDTLFVGGCGRFFEGTAAEMHSALIDVLSNLPEDTKVFCGHEYTVQNLSFASFVEPMNDQVMKKMTWSMERRQHGLPTVPSTIKEEKAYNPFMRVKQSSVMQHAGIFDSIEAMKIIRMQKDNFKG